MKQLEFPKTSLFISKTLLMALTFLQATNQHLVESGTLIMNLLAEKLVAKEEIKVL
jgi:hypothetical protein